MTACQTSKAEVGAEMGGANPLPVGGGGRTRAELTLEASEIRPGGVVRPVPRDTSGIRIIRNGGVRSM